MDLQGMKKTGEMETARLLLRFPKREDAEPLAAVWADPDVTRFAGGPRDFDRVRALVEEEAGCPGDRRWSVVERTTGLVVGDCGFVEKEVEGRKESELIYFFAKAAWNRGFATEAAAAALGHGRSVLGLTRVVALIDPGNTASERVARKLGMIPERDVLQKGRKMRLYVWER